MYVEIGVKVSVITFVQYILPTTTALSSTEAAPEAEEEYRFMAELE